jgi:hypothetical protein
MIDHKDTLPAANAEPEVAQTHSAHVKNTGTVTPVDELSEDALDSVAGGGNGAQALLDKYNPFR